MGRDFLSQLPGRAANIGGLGLDMAALVEAAQSPATFQAYLQNQALARSDPALRGELERSPFLAGALGGQLVHAQPVPPSPSEIAQLGQLPVPARIGAYGELAQAPGRPRQLRPSLPPLSAASRAQTALESAEEREILRDPTAAARAKLRIPQPIPPGTNVRLTRIGPSGPVYEVVQPGGDLQPTNVTGMYRDPVTNRLVRAPTAPGVAATAHADAMADADAHKLGFRGRTDPGYIATKQAQAGMVPVAPQPSPTPQVPAPPAGAVPPPPVPATAEPGFVPPDQLDLDAPLDETPGRGYPPPAFRDIGEPAATQEFIRDRFKGQARERTAPRSSLSQVVPALPPALQGRATDALRDNPDWSREDFSRWLVRQGNLSPEDVKQLQRERRTGYPSPAPELPGVRVPGRPALPAPSPRGPARQVQTQAGAMSVPIRPPVGAGKTSDFTAVSAEKALGIATRAKQAIVRLRQAGILTDNPALALTGWNRGRLELAARMTNTDKLTRQDAVFLLRNLVAAVPTFARGFGEQRVNQQEEQRIRETFAFNTIPADYAEAVLDNYIELFGGGAGATTTTVPAQGRFLGFVGEGGAR